MREKIALLVLLLSAVALGAFGHAIGGGQDRERQSEPSCSEENRNELVCSEEVLAAIKRETEQGPQTPPAVTDAPAPQSSVAPGAEAPEEGGLGEDEYYYDEYYDDE
jgi:hypothetical protein